MSIIYSVLVAVSAIAIVMNWLGVIVAMRRKHTYSLMPQSFFAFVGSAAAWMHPNPAISKYFWLPLLVDPGLGFVPVIFLAQKIIRRARS